MTPVLRQSRTCDGACCRQAPRWPIVVDGEKSCQFLRSDGRCAILEGSASIPPGPCPAMPEEDAEKVFHDTCRDWPQNTAPDDDLGACCWTWFAQG
jgi:hypothetical protein